MEEDLKLRTVAIDEIPPWQDEIPPYGRKGALQALSVAKSYYDARYLTEGVNRFTYSQTTFLTNGSNDDIFDSETHKCQIDCSTYMHLVLRGISYDKSPYCTEEAAISTEKSSHGQMIHWELQTRLQIH